MATVAAGAARGRRLRHATENRGVLASLLISPAVMFIGVLVGGPLLLAIYLSFTHATAGSLSGTSAGFSNFTSLLHNPAFRQAVWNTFLFTVISQLVVLVVAGLLAHALIRSFRGRWGFRFLILLPWAAPVALTTTGFLWFFDPLASVFNWFLIHLHLVTDANKPNWIGTHNDAMASIITVHAWRIIPFATVIFLAGISSIPAEVDDASAIDGATGLKKFWYVSLPLQLPIAIVAVLFGIVFTATDMAVVYILTNGNAGTDVLTTFAFKTGIESGSTGEGAAVTLFMLPVLAVVAIGMLFFAKRAEVT